mgnify:CR=1 FL=1
MRRRIVKELNQHIVKRSPEYAQGFLDAVSLLDEMYSSSSTHPYMLGDCLLWKVNLLVGRIRRNPKAVKIDNNQKD